MFAISHDLEEEYCEIFMSSGRLRSGLWYWWHGLKAVRFYFTLTFYWSIAMFKNYFIISFRNIRKYKGYSFINISGLAIGITCFILIMLWVQDEIGYDRFHTKREHIYRVESNLTTQPAPLAPHLKENFPGVVNSVRFSSFNNADVRYKDKRFIEPGFDLADNSVFEIFTFPLLRGNPEDVLKKPYCVVISEETAQKYFGDEDPVGKSLTVENNYQFTITGIMKNVRDNTRLRCDFLASFETLISLRPVIRNHWGDHAYFTYVLLNENIDYRELNVKIKNIVIDKIPDANMSVPLSLMPFGRLHLYEDGAIKYVYIFLAVAIFTLIIAIINFINLTTAKSSNRLKEIGLRKVVGASRSNLIKQFLAESIFLSFLAFIIAFILAVIILPNFNAIVDKNLNLNFIENRYLLLMLTVTALMTGLLSGSYPAILMSSFHPVTLIRKSLFPGNKTSKSSSFRKILVIIQFTISIFLIISTLLVLSQLNFIKNMDLGYNKENLIYLTLKRNVSRNRESFRMDLLKNPDVLNLTFASSLPSNVANNAVGMDWEGKDPNLKPSWRFVVADFYYIKTLGLDVIDGRDFSEDISTDKRQSFIVNEKAFQEMEQSSPIGKRFSLWGTDGTLIGVIKDFHFRPLHTRIAPLFLWINPNFYNYVIIRLKPGTDNLQEVLSYIEGIWKQYEPDFEFTYNFLDESFERQYRAEQRMSAIFKYFTFLAIFISCLGLFGLVAFTAEQRKKEIGIRKVVGASLPNIVALLIKEYFVLIILSNIIAWPAAFFAMRKWMQNFAYHTDIALWIFLVSAASSLIIALITISYQAIKAAALNPVDSLKYE